MSADDNVMNLGDDASRDLAALARSVDAADRARVAPPDDLWAAIADELAADAATTGHSTTDRFPDATMPAAPATPEPANGGNVVRLRRRTTTIVLSAAAALLVLAGAVALVGSGDDEPGGDLVATGSLDPLAEGFGGGVELVDVDGELQLDLRLDTLPPTEDAYYELWLIKDLETGEMQSLGPIDDSGRVSIPSGLDPVAYATVDISIEPLDGIPTHSGQSVLRGGLDI